MPKTIMCSVEANRSGNVTSRLISTSENHRKNGFASNGDQHNNRRNFWDQQVLNQDHIVFV